MNAIDLKRNLHAASTRADASERAVSKDTDIKELKAAWIYTLHNSSPENPLTRTVLAQNNKFETIQRFYFIFLNVKKENDSCIWQTKDSWSTWDRSQMAFPLLQERNLR